MEHVTAWVMGGSGMYRSFDELLEAAQRLGLARIAVVAGHDPDAIQALDAARRTGLAEAVYVGDAEKVTAAAASAGVAIPLDAIVHEPDAERVPGRAIALVREGKADLLMKGKISTAGLIRAVLDKDSGLRSGRLLSQVIAFSVPGQERLMLLTDAAINVAPSLQQKADICRNAIEVAQAALGIEHPNVALLCAIEFVNPDMPATIDAAALTQMNRRGQISGAYLDGPIALDAVLNKFAAESKKLDSPLVENTDILVAPDIEAANILYRAILYFAKGESGGVVVGAKVPLILLSRAETADTKLRSIAIAKLVAAATAARPDR